MSDEELSEIMPLSFSRINKEHLSPVISQHEKENLENFELKHDSKQALKEKDRRALLKTPRQGTGRTRTKRQPKSVVKAPQKPLSPQEGTSPHAALKGRRTGVTIKEKVVRDDDGLDNIDDFFNDSDDDAVPDLCAPTPPATAPKSRRKSVAATTPKSAKKEKAATTPTPKNTKKPSATPTSGPRSGKRDKEVSITPSPQQQASLIETPKSDNVAVPKKKLFSSPMDEGPEMEMDGFVFSPIHPSPKPSKSPKQSPKKAKATSKSKGKGKGKGKEKAVASPKPSTSRVAPEDWSDNEPMEMDTPSPVKPAPKAHKKTKTTKSKTHKTKQAAPARKSTGTKRKLVKEEDVPGTVEELCEPEPRTPGLRRSKRKKLAPLQFWKNERVVYDRGDEDMPTITKVYHPAGLTPEASRISTNNKWVESP